MNDVYQERYIAHQARKAEVLKQIMIDRHSDRVFGNKKVTPEVLDDILSSVSQSASSCGRMAVTAQIITDRDHKALLGGMLVGGVGWVHRAPVIMLLFADPIAYKADEEIKFMPYLDAGVIAGSLYLKVASMGMKGCFVNPNIREFNKEYFTSTFGDGIFCGAFALGYEENEEEEDNGETIHNEG